MTVTTEDETGQNLFAKELQMYTMEVTVTHNEKAELLNGRVAMIGIIAALQTYAVTGQGYPWSVVTTEPDIYLDKLNDEAVRVQPKSVHGMLWLQTHFETDTWEILSIRCRRYPYIWCNQSFARCI